jgi:hypothetical protein
MKNVILFLMICFWSCSKKQEESAPDSTRSASEMNLSASNETQEGSHVNAVQFLPPEDTHEAVIGRKEYPILKKLVKNGVIEFETADIDKTKSQITAAVTANKGYVSSDQENKMHDKRQYTLVVRVPAGKFDAFLASATKDILYFDRKQINVKDVTAEYFDSEARLKAKKEIEAKYLQLLSRTSNVKDILEIEKELGAVRIEIESAEGQLKLLSDEIQYSTLEISFYKISSAPSLFSYRIKSAFVTGWENLLGFLIIVIDLWPFVLLGTGLWYVMARFKRKKTRTKHPEAV